MQARPYQREAVEAVHEYIIKHKGERWPCVVLPTAAGKSPVMAWLLQRWIRMRPNTKWIVLAHVKELVEQNADKMLQIWPECDIGIYAAGLRKKQTGNQVIYASIDSVYNKHDKFGHVTGVIIDEAHRIPLGGEGKYRRFINDLKEVNPKLVGVGVTATPYRLKGGTIVDDDYILNDICYEAFIPDLLSPKNGDSPYLCPLISKANNAQINTTGVKKSGGDYTITSLAEAADKKELVRETVDEALKFIKKHNRKACIWFCVNKEHCEHVLDEIRNRGEHAEMVTGDTPRSQRDKHASDFKDGKLKHLVNINVYTDGFDAPRLDCVLMLRPTMSMGLYYQMVGRGLRVHPSKSYTLILDFAGNVDSHGPIDCLEGNLPDMIVCGDEECRSVFPRPRGSCPDCGWLIPKMKTEEGGITAGRKLNSNRASNKSILSHEPDKLNVDDAFAKRHIKEDGIDSIRVTYRCGQSMYSEWICLDHDGYAKSKANEWWSKRFGTPIPSVSKALDDMFLGQSIRDITESILIKKDGKFWSIVGHELRN